MQITWYGTASILLETEDIALLFDPFMKDLPPGRETQEARERRRDIFRQQRYVFITHGHFDHLSSVAELYRDLDCMVYVTAQPYKVLRRQGFPPGALCLLQPGDVVSLPGATVRAYQSRHIRFDLPLCLNRFRHRETWRQLPRAMGLAWKSLRYPEKGQSLLYEVEAAGARVQILGSADLVPGMAYPVGADALVLPHQGRSDIDAHNEKIVEALAPARVFLDHYDDAFPPVTSPVPTEAFCRKVSQKIPAQALLEGETIVL